MMKVADEILAQIEECILENKYKKLETDKVEIKDLSGGISTNISPELYKSACAFLNAEGGMIIIGIHENEREQKYQLTGYNPETENAIKELPKKFSDRPNGSTIDLSDNFPAPQIRNLMGKQICVVYVEKLDEEKKYVFYDGIAYKRRITGDHKLKQEDINLQNERKEEIKNARELQTVENATLSDLNVDKLNDYILRLNRETRVETIKADIHSAISFLTRKGFVQTNIPTLLGILVCGDHIYDLLGGRCQVDGYVDSPSPVKVAQNKQVLKDNILDLMDKSVGFIYKNIQVGVTSQGSGSAIPEYPETLIRETVNNALAHRDYGIDKFVNIIIKPNESIQIRNPGSFRQEQRLKRDENFKVRRIIPMPKARNPRLADILKTYDRWEGRGIGMASLTNASLDNEVGVPYYVFHSENDISLFIPKGKTLNEKMELWLKSFSGYISEKTNYRDLSEQEKLVLCYFYQSELLNRAERYTILLTSDNNHFAVIDNLEKNGLIFQHPNSPDIYPIYLVDRILIQDDFTDKLRKLFGSDYDGLKNDYKEVLQTIYQHNEYSLQKTISARATGDFLYLKKNIVIISSQDFENFKRKIRNIFNWLEQKRYIININSDLDKKRAQYILNSNYASEPSLFDNIK